MLIERPLAELPTGHAEAFVRAMFASNQRFARVYHQTFRALGQNEPTAKLATRVELHRVTSALIRNLADPNLHTIGIQKVAVSWEEAGGAAAYQPIAMFSYDPVTNFACCAGILDEHASPEMQEALAAAIARHARAAGHEAAIVIDADDETLSRAA